MRVRTFLPALAVALFAVALFLPTGWYASLPKPKENLPPAPVSGATLVRLAFAVEGLLLLAVSRERKIFSIPEGERLDPEPRIGRAVAHPRLWLAGITILAAALRFWRVSSDLWLDEITTVLDYRRVSAFHVLTAYTSSNNHLLNTLAVKAMIALFGPAEWAIRLPAVLLGIAGVPALYFLASRVLRSREALMAALLLSVSYHHIFFSQNARGYTGLFFWSSLGTGFFLRALSSDRPRDWAAYLAAMLLAVATVLYGLFLVAGQVASALAVAWSLRRQGKRVGPTAAKLACIWGTLGLLCFHVYASIIPQVYVYLGSVYTRPSVGYAPFARDHALELARGIAAGFGGRLVPVALVAAAFVLPGLWLYFRSHPVSLSVLVLPLVVTAAFLLLAGLRFSPRFFLWAVPAGCLLAVAIPAEIAARFFGIRPVSGVLPAAACALLCGLSIASLPAYYSTPKQPTRESLAWVQARRSNGDALGAVYLAKWGLRFYGPPNGLREGKEFFDVDNVGDLDALESRAGGRTVWLLVTFRRALRLDFPDLERRIERDFREVRSFPATVGDGGVTVLLRARAA
ncbi:MAG: glycosyltransferase family 39 protein [Thermoanaerobaculia bacterium]